MTDFYKAGNRKTAAKFARRLLEGNSKIDDQSKTADQVLQDSKEDNRDVQQPNYDFAKPFKTPIGFARRLLGANSTTDDQSKAAHQVLLDSKKNTRDLWELNYDFAKHSKICCSTLNPINEGKSSVICAHCYANFAPSQKGQLCSICDVAVIVPVADSARQFYFPMKDYKETAA